MKQAGIWIGIIVILLATFWGLIALVNSTSSSANPIAQAKHPASVSKNDITLGIASKAKVTLIEYADFQCPACKAYAESVKKLNKDFKDDLFIAYRFIPLDIHKNALTSAQAAYAAYKQNKFWEMDELLYQNQDSWADLDNPQKAFTEYAKKINLDIDQFIKDYNTDETLKFINSQKDEGISINITYAPSFFVNGKLIENPQNYEAFKQIIQNALNNK